VVNRDKLKKGMDAIADHVESLGMKFGLWFEPEMVNEDSDLFRAHPDWALTDPDRKPVMGRDQLVLDMSRPEVVDYLYESIAAVLNSAKISCVKWDFNRSLANVFSRGLPADRQGEVAHRFVLGAYSLMERLRESFSDVMIEGCSGDGGRFDAGIMFYSPQIWCSDNTEAINRLRIQKGKYLRLSDETDEEYYTSWGFVSEDKSEALLNLVVTDVRANPEVMYVRLHGLDPEAEYEVDNCISSSEKVPENDAGEKTKIVGQIFSGAALMNAGYAFDPMFGSYPAVQLHFKKI